MIRWQWTDPTSIPSAEDAPETRARSRYSDVRRVIALGEALHSQHRVEAGGWKQTEAAVRGGAGEEFEVVAVAPQGSPGAEAGPSTEPHVPHVQHDFSSLAEPAPIAARPYTVLFVGANSEGGAFLNIESECEKAETALKLERGADAWRGLVVFHADRYATAATLMRRIQDTSPAVLQFSCHGELHGLWLSDRKVDRSALVSSLERYNRSPQTKEGIRLLIITACISGPLAEELGAFVDFVIGHGLEEVRDSDAINFTHTLYHSLGQGRSLAESFAAAHLASPAFRLVARRADPEGFFLPTPESSDALNEKVQELQDRLQEVLSAPPLPLPPVLTGHVSSLPPY